MDFCPSVESKLIWFTFFCSTVLHLKKLFAQYPNLFFCCNSYLGHMWQWYTVNRIHTCMVSVYTISNEEKKSFLAASSSAPVWFSVFTSFIICPKEPLAADGCNKNGLLSLDFFSKNQFFASIQKCLSKYCGMYIFVP